MSERGADLIVLTPSAGVPVPAIIASAGKRAARHFVEFFTATIQNQNTREAYARAINAFLSWCEDEAGTPLDMIEPVVVAAYVEKLLKKDGLSKPTVKQHLARSACCSTGWWSARCSQLIRPRPCAAQNSDQKRQDAGADA